MRLLFVTLILSINFNLSASVLRLSRLTVSKALNLPKHFMQPRALSSKNFSSNTPQEPVTQKDLTDLKYFIHQELTNTKDYLCDQNHWDIDLARVKMIESLENEGNTPEESVKIFRELDQEIDKDRNLWNLPYYGSLALASLGIPLTWIIVYNPSFYNKVLEQWPWLEHTSWDWTEPLVQGLLTTQTQGAIIFTSLVALGFRPYQKFRNNKMAKKIEQKWGIDERVAKKFVKVDR